MLAGLVASNANFDLAQSSTLRFLTLSNAIAILGRAALARIPVADLCAGLHFHLLSDLIDSLQASELGKLLLNLEIGRGPAMFSLDNEPTEMKSNYS